MRIDRNKTALSTEKRLIIEKNYGLSGTLPPQLSHFLGNAPKIIHPLCMVFATLFYNPILAYPRLFESGRDKHLELFSGRKGINFRHFSGVPPKMLHEFSL